MCDNIKSEMYIIDPKAISKKALYGSLDPTTLEWTGFNLFFVFFMPQLENIVHISRGILMSICDAQGLYYSYTMYCMEQRECVCVCIFLLVSGIYAC